MHIDRRGQSLAVTQSKPLENRLLMQHITPRTGNQAALAALGLLFEGGGLTEKPTQRAAGRGGSAPGPTRTVRRKRSHKKFDIGLRDARH